MTGGDIVHGDFAPENVLARRGHLSGVIDWEQCRVGDARIDLVGLLFDMELGAKARPAVRSRPSSNLLGGSWLRGCSESRRSRNEHRVAGDRPSRRDGWGLTGKEFGQGNGVKEGTERGGREHD